MINGDTFHPLITNIYGWCYLIVDLKNYTILETIDDSIHQNTLITDLHLK
jgi:hypothetical protein